MLEEKRKGRTGWGQNGDGEIKVDPPHHHHQIIALGNSSDHKSKLMHTKLEIRNSLEKVH